MYTGAIYQQAVPGKFIPFNKFGVWALGNFATVAELKSAIPKIFVSGSDNKKYKDMGLHMGFHDATGQSIVVEFINGKVNIYNNPLGVMTNRPSFDWQMTNLRNYVNLQNSDKNTKAVNGVKIEPTGVGSGMLGLPGDWTPPSRFVKIAYTLDSIITPKTSSEAVTTALHILNIVDIPKGVIKENPKPFVTMFGYAQWVVVKDLTNKILYFKTYDDLTLKSVDLKKFNLSKGAARKSFPMDSNKMTIKDISGKFN
jgi:choloylglycine hydrolase